MDDQYTSIPSGGGINIIDMIGWGILGALLGAILLAPILSVTQSPAIAFTIFGGIIVLFGWIGARRNKQETKAAMLARASKIPPPPFPVSSVDIQATQPGSMVSIRMLVRTSWGLYKFGWKNFAKIYFLTFVSPLFFSLIFFAYTVLPRTPVTSILLGFLALIGIIAALFWGLWCTAANLMTVFSVATSETSTIRTLFTRARPFIGGVFMTGLLYGMVTIFGVILFVIPGILMSIWFSLVLYILIHEQLRGSVLLSRSKQYVTGHWWGVFWRYIVFSLYFTVPVTVSVMIIQSLARLADSNTIVGVAQVLIVIIEISAAFVITPLSLIYGYLIYADLARLKNTQRVS